MFILGITGGIGCGKSTAAGVLQNRGLTVLDADQLSHEVTAPGGIAIPEIIERFGPEYIQEDGSLNREKMAQMVFKDRTMLDRLSLIIHRHVMAEIKRRCESLRNKKERAVVLDVPVPVKEGFLDSCDQIWVIWADEDVRLERLAERGMSEEEATRRMKIQMTKEEYTNLGTELVMNNGTVHELEDKLNILIERELLARGIPMKAGQNGEE